MQRHFSTASALTSGLLKKEDFKTYKNFCKQLTEPERYKKYLNNEGALLFDDNKHYKMFCLWLDDKIIGQSMIAFDPDAPDNLAVFCETEILTEYRGNGYAHHLHEARRNYLKKIDFVGTVETHIKPDNIPSLRAAEKNGFTDTGKSLKGFKVLQI
jgi:RimJ/RimL family protein N-acetyltransferase